MKLNPGALLGSVIVFLVVGYALSDATLAPFLNLHSIILVCFGTAGILLISSPSGELKTLFRQIFQGDQDQKDPLLLQKDLISLARNRFSPLDSGHELILYAQSLWEQGVDDRLFRILLRQKALQHQQGGERSVLLLRNLAKYPPALGMTGTVIGLVSLFSGFGAEGRLGIGPALALAMTATFYGLILSNALLMPLADKVQSQQLKIANWNEQVMQTLLLIHEGQPEAVIEERKYA